MKNAQLDEALFDKFLDMLESKGIKPQGGTLVDGKKTGYRTWHCIT